MQYKYSKIFFLIIILIIFLLYNYYTNIFILNDNKFNNIEIKTKQLQYENIYKKDMIKKINFNNKDYNKIINKLDENFNIALKLLKIEIEQIKNLNKKYCNKINNNYNYSELKSQYNKELNNINNNGYNYILLLEQNNSKLIKHYISYYKNKCNKLLIDDIYNILQNYYINLNNIKNTKNGILKNNNLNKKIFNNKKCNLQIRWFDNDNIKLYCCK